MADRPLSFHVGVFCPEAKIFQPRYHELLMADPTKMYLEDDSFIIVPRSSGDIKFQLGKIRSFGRLPSTDREQDLVHLVPWLTGGREGNENQETDCYGVADLGLDDDILGEITLVTTAGRKVDGELAKMIRDGQEHATKVSRSRVYREIRRVVAQIEAQYSRNVEGGYGKYEPSPCEYLCTFALRKELEEERKRKAGIVKNFEEMLSSASTAKAEPFATPQA